MGQRLALGVLVVASCAALAYVGTTLDGGHRAVLLGSPSGNPSSSADLSWVQVLAGAAVEPMQGTQAVQARRRQVQPRGWRHARVLSSAVGQTAPWAANAAAVQAASRVAGRGPAERAARGRAAAERRRKQQMVRDSTRYEQMRGARQAAEKEERLAAAGNLEQSLRAIAAYMAPSGRKARSRFQRAVDDFMAKEQARERARGSQGWGHESQVTSDQRMKQEQSQEEKQMHRMKKTKDFLRSVKKVVKPSKAPKMAVSATNSKVAGRAIPSLEIVIDGKQAQIELPISGGDLEVPLENVAVAADDKTLDVPIAHMHFKRNTQKDVSQSKSVELQSGKVEHVKEKVSERRNKSERAKEDDRAKATRRKYEEREDALRRQKALEDAESSFPSKREIMKDEEEYADERREREEEEVEREEKEAKALEAKEEEKNQERALEEAESSFPAEGRGPGGAFKTSAELDAEEERGRREEDKMMEEGRHEGGKTARRQKMKGVGMAQLKHEDKAALVSLALRVPMDPGECSASVRDKIEAAIAQAAGVGASEVSVVSYGKYSVDRQPAGRKVADDILDKRKDLSVERNESEIHEAAMRLQDRWIDEFESSGELGSDDLKQDADDEEGEDEDEDASGGSRRRLLTADDAGDDLAGDDADDDGEDGGEEQDATRVDLEVKAASQEAAEDIVAQLTEENINAELMLAGLPAADLVSDPHVVSPVDNGSDNGVSSSDAAPKPKHHHIPHPHPDFSHHARHAPQPHWNMPGGIWKHHEVQQPKHDPTKLEKLGVNVDGVGGVYRAFAVPFFDETQVIQEKVVHEGTNLPRSCSVCQLVSVSPYS